MKKWTMRVCRFLRVATPLLLMNCGPIFATEQRRHTIDSEIGLLTPSEEGFNILSFRIGAFQGDDVPEPEPFRLEGDVKCGETVWNAVKRFLSNPKVRNAILFVLNPKNTILPIGTGLVKFAYDNLEVFLRATSFLDRSIFGCTRVVLATIGGKLLALLEIIRKLLLDKRTRRNDGTAVQTHDYYEETEDELDEIIVIIDGVAPVPEDVDENSIVTLRVASTEEVGELYNIFANTF